MIQIAPHNSRHPPLRLRNPRRCFCRDGRMAVPADLASWVACPNYYERNHERQQNKPITDSYFAEWRAMKDPGGVEALLISAFAKCGVKSPVVQKWLASKALFFERAAEFLSEAICAGRKAVDGVLRDHYVGPLTKLGMSVRASATRSACEYLRRFEARRDNEWSLRYLQVRGGRATGIPTWTAADAPVGLSRRSGHELTHGADQGPAPREVRI